MCVLQASLVEEQISIAALERARELTCVSVLAASVNNITLQLLASSITKGVDPLSAAGVATSPRRQSAGVVSGVGNRSADAEGATDVEIHRDDIVGSLTISTVNLQLRRMKKFSNYSDQVILTAIPEHRSQAYFTFGAQDDSDSHSRVSPISGSVTSESVSHSRKSSPDDIVTTPVEDVAGFIMFECGLDGIGVQVARRKGYGTKKMPNDGVVPPVAGSNSVKANENGDDAINAKVEPPVVSKTVPINSKDRSPDVDDASSDTSADGNSADDEASSHRSRTSKSFDNLTQENEDLASPTAHNVIADRLSGDAASGVLHFATVWFNFAAPPPSPRKRKLEYTRYTRGLYFMTEMLFTRCLP